MRGVRKSSLQEYAGWYLQREAKKAGSEFAQADADAQVETMRQHHAGKMRTWFDASTQWQIAELKDTDLAKLVFLECSWTKGEGLVVPGGPNYRLLRCVAATGCKLVLNEVYEGDIDGFVTRAEAFFALMPAPDSERELSEHSPLFEADSKE